MESAEEPNKLMVPLYISIDSTKLFLYTTNRNANLLIFS